MKKYLLIGLALTALLSTSCADDFANDSIGTKVAPAIESVDTTMMCLRNLYKETWDSGCIEEGTPYIRIEEPDIEDMIAFLTWASDTYDWVQDSCYFDEVAELLGYTKVWHEEGYWEIYKNN